MQEFVDAFELLSTRRSAGFNINPISLSEIYTYIKLYGTIDPTRFIRHIVSMDMRFLKLVADKQAAESNNKAK